MSKRRAKRVFAIISSHTSFIETRTISLWSTTWIWQCTFNTWLLPWSKTGAFWIATFATSWARPYANEKSHVQAGAPTAAMFIEPRRHGYMYLISIRHNQSATENSHFRKALPQLRKVTSSHLIGFLSLKQVTTRLGSSQTSYVLVLMLAVQL